MAMPVSVLREVHKPPPDWPLADRPALNLKQKPEPPPLASDGKVVSIWKGKGDSWIQTPLDEELVAVLRRIHLPRLAQGDDAVTEDDSAYYHAALAHITPIGLSSAVRTDGTNVLGNPHRVDTINLAGNPWDERKSGSVCTWVGFTHSENPAAWAAAAVRARRRTLRSQQSRRRHNKPETTAFLNQAVIGDYTRPPTTEWFWSHPDGRYSWKDQHAWPVGKFEIGYADSQVQTRMQNQEKLWREWFSSISSLERALLEMSKLDMSEAQLKERELLLDEFLVNMYWTFNDPFAALARQGHTEPAPLVQVWDIDGQKTVFEDFQIVHEGPGLVLPEEETEKCNPSVRLVPTLQAANDESVLEGEYEVLNVESQPPTDREVRNVSYEISHDRFYVNIKAGGQVEGNLYSPKFLSELEGEHIPKARAFLDTLVNLKLTAEALQYGSLVKALGHDFNVDGLMDDHEIEMEIERIPLDRDEAYLAVWQKTAWGEADPLRLYPLSEPPNRRPLTNLLAAEQRAEQVRRAKEQRRKQQRGHWTSRLYGTASINKSRFRDWSLGVEHTLYVHKCRRLKQKYLDEVAAWRAEQRIGREISSLQSIGYNMREWQMKRNIKRWYLEASLRSTRMSRAELRDEVDYIKWLAEDKDRLKPGVVLRYKRMKMRLKLKLMRKPVPEFLKIPAVEPYTESVYLTQRPKLKRPGVVAPKAESKTNESAKSNIIILDPIEAVKQIRSMRFALIASALHDLKEVIEHEELVINHFPEMKRAAAMLDGKPIIPDVPSYREDHSEVMPYRRRVASRMQDHTARRRSLVA